MYNPLLMEKTMRRTLIILTLLAASGIALAKPVAETAAPLLLKPTADQTEAAIWAMRFLSRFHYKPMPLDDAMSEKIFKSYVESLDAEHLFFTQADMDRFAEARDKLDDAIFERDLSAPFAMFNLYEQRVAERLEHARELLAKPFDFTKDESYELDRSKAAWAANSTELDELWRKRVKNDWLRLKLAGKQPAEIRATLERSGTPIGSHDLFIAAHARSRSSRSLRGMRRGASSRRSKAGTSSRPSRRALSARRPTALWWGERRAPKGPEASWSATPRRAASPVPRRDLAHVQGNLVQLRCALEALDYCIEDSAELLNERATQWGSYRKDRQAAMAATLERHRAVAERLRAMLMA